MTDFNEILKIQRNIASRLHVEEQMDNKLKLFDLIRSFNKKKVQTEQVILEAKYSGFSESDTLALLDELEKDGYLKQEEGYILID